ncbi:MAG TPA: hypothetical protein VH092_22195 [Urbifossiella sp.]|jgi:hypothetical protein|nr:hypothetical protein [Urbifossiella sp.]
MKERVRRMAAALAGDAGVPVTDAAWAAAFDRLGADGYFAREPDFPRAMAAYRAALAATPDTPPPPGFEPALSYRDRYEAWRRACPRPGVTEGLAWVAELFLRIQDSTPTVSEPAFAALAGWVRANEARLRGLADADGLVHLGDGTGAVLAEVLAAVGRGPQRPGAGAAAEMIRRLQARYGGEGAG